MHSLPGQRARLNSISSGGGGGGSLPVLWAKIWGSQTWTHLLSRHVSFGNFLILSGRNIETSANSINCFTYQLQCKTKVLRNDKILKTASMQKKCISVCSVCVTLHNSLVMFRRSGWHIGFWVFLFPVLSIQWILATEIFPVGGGKWLSTELSKSISSPHPQSIQLPLGCSGKSSVGGWHVSWSFQSSYTALFETT